MRTLLVLLVVGGMVVLASSLSLAQDRTITNSYQFADLLDQPGLDYPLVEAWRPSMFYPTLGVFYCDFSQLTNAIGDIRNTTPSVQDGINVWPVRLIRTASGTAFVYPFTDTTLLTLPACEDNDFEAQYEEVLRSFCILTGGNPTSYDDLIAQGFEFLAPKNIVLDVWLADVNDRPLLPNVGSMTMMDDECDPCDDPPPTDGEVEYIAFDPNDPPCGRLTYNKFKVSTNNFILEWFSQTNTTYEIASTTNLVSGNWIGLASQYPAATGTNLTSYIDVGANTNVAKFYKVVQTGVSILMCDSNTLSGTVDIPVEIGIPSNTTLSALTFVVDDEGSRAMTDPQPPFISQVSGNFDTTLVTNGWHTIQAVASYPSSSLGGYDVYTSQVVVVRTQNHVTFPDMLFTWGNSLNIRAFLDTQITNWIVNIYAGDYSDSPSDHLLRTYSGITSNGLIDLVWDGNDSNGVAFAPGVFTNVTFLVNDPVGKSVWREGGQQPPNFFVSYVPLLGEFSPGSVNFVDMISQIAQFVAASDPTYILDTSGTGIESTWYITDTASGWNDWIAKIIPNQMPNLFFFGHGNPKAIGGASPNGGFTVAEIENFTGNSVVKKGFIFKSYSPNFRHPFHFVFLDGCETAKGNWCEAFGIERQKTTTAAYQTNNVAPKAFLGWKVETGYASGGQFSREHDDFVVHVFQDWSSSSARGLQDALDVNPRRTLAGQVRIWGAQDLKWAGP